MLYLPTYHDHTGVLWYTAKQQVALPRNRNERNDTTIEHIHRVFSTYIVRVCVVGQGSNIII